MLRLNRHSDWGEMEKTQSEIIRGKDLRLTEKDIYKSLSIFGKLDAFLFGGTFSVNEVTSKDPTKNRGIVVYIPPLHKRFYWKVIYRAIHRKH